MAVRLSALRAGRPSPPRKISGSLDFSIDLSLPAALWPLGSTQPLTDMSTKIFLGVKGGRRIRLTTWPPSVSWLSRENVGASTSHNPVGRHGLSEGELYFCFIFFFLYFLQPLFNSFLSGPNILLSTLSLYPSPNAWGSFMPTQNCRLYYGFVTF
jgi:hypothetical protein